MPYQHGGFVVAPAGSRDTVHATVPGTHIVTGGRAPWDRDLDAIPGFASLPPADDACSSILGVGRLGLSMSNPDPSRGFAGLCEEALGSGAPRWTTLKGGA